MLERKLGNSFANCTFLAEGNPKLLTGFVGRRDPDKIVNDLTLADATELQRFIANQFFDFLFRGRWQIDHL